MKTVTISPASRLEYYRQEAAKAPGTNWRTVAGDYRSRSPARVHRTIYNPDCGEWYGMGHCRWIEDTEQAGLRFVGHSDDILPRSIRHTGWFVDNCESETVRGGVWQLPSRRGEMLFVCGYVGPWTNGSTFISFEVVRENTANLDPCDFESVESLESVRDCARWANQMAQTMAEESRAYNAREQAEWQIEEARERITQMRNALSDYQALVSDLRKRTDLPPMVRDVIRRQIKEMRADVRREIALIRERKADYWSAV